MEALSAPAIHRIRRLQAGEMQLHALSFTDEVFDRGWVAALACALRTSASLRELYFANCEFTGPFTDMIACSLHKNTRLKLLDLRSSSVGALGAEAIASMLRVNATIAELSLTHTEIGDEGVAALGNALAQGSSLLSLALVGNGIGPYGAGCIASALHLNQSLKTLDMSGNVIGDTGANVIADAMRVNRALTALELGENGIRDHGTSALAAALQHHPTLVSLTLFTNAVGLAGALAIASLVEHHTQIQHLDLSYNALGNAGVRALACALMRNTSLTSVDIAGVGIDDDAAVELAALLGGNTTLQQLAMNGNEVGSAGMELLARSLRRNCWSLTTLHTHAQHNMTPRDAWLADSSLHQIMSRNRILRKVLVSAAEEVLVKRADATWLAGRASARRADEYVATSVLPPYRLPVGIVAAVLDFLVPRTLQRAVLGRWADVNAWLRLGLAYEYYHPLHVVRISSDPPRPCVCYNYSAGFRRHPFEQMHEVRCDVRCWNCNDGCSLRVVPWGLAHGCYEMRESGVWPCESKFLNF